VPNHALSALKDQGVAGDQRGSASFSDEANTPVGLDPGHYRPSPTSEGRSGAFAVVSPHNQVTRPDRTWPVWNGLRIAQAIFDKFGSRESAISLRLLDLVALGTVDIAPLVAEPLHRAADWRIRATKRQELFSQRGADLTCAHSAVNIGFVLGRGSARPAGSRSALAMSC
jgi:hypothetical protein